MFFDLFKRKSGPPSFDRRREERYSAEDDFAVEFSSKGDTVSAATDPSWYVGNGRDISLHGVKFATTYKLPVHKKVLLTFKFPMNFPGSKREVIPATVVRRYKPRGAERYRVGCSLEHQQTAGRETIRQFICWHQLQKK